MLHFRITEPVVLRRTKRPLCQAAVFLGITYLLAFAIALALPHAGFNNAVDGFSGAATATSPAAISPGPRPGLA